MYFILEDFLATSSADISPQHTDTIVICKYINSPVSVSITGHVL